jgi:hypothetical protein
MGNSASAERRARVVFAPVTARLIEWPGIEDLRERAAESGGRLEADSSADVERMLDWVSEYVEEEP